MAPSGSGKTVIGLELIAKRSQPALILVRRKQLLDQWVERIESFLGIPKTKIGQISGNKKKPGDQITVAMIQSLLKVDDLSEISHSFGTIILDECHHVPARTFRELISNLNSYYLYGLTAAPQRKYNDEKLIYYYLGDEIVTIEPDQQKSSSKNVATAVHIQETTLSTPFDYKTDVFEVISKILIYDSARNLLICRDVWVFEPAPPVYELPVPNFRHYVVFEDTLQVIEYVRAVIRSYDDRSVIPAAMGGAAVGAGIGEMSSDDRHESAALWGAGLGAAVSFWLVKKGLESQRPAGRSIRCPNQRCQIMFQMHTRTPEFPCPACRQRMTVAWEAWALT